MKICAKGSTTWAPIILGGRAIDSVERSGLGVQPLAHGFYLGALKMQIDLQTFAGAEHLHAVLVSYTQQQAGQGPTPGLGGAASSGGGSAPMAVSALKKRNMQPIL